MPEELASFFGLRLRLQTHWRPSLRPPLWVSEPPIQTVASRPFRKPPSAPVSTMDRAEGGAADGPGKGVRLRGPKAVSGRSGKAEIPPAVQTRRPVRWSRVPSLLTVARGDPVPEFPAPLRERGSESVSSAGADPAPRAWWRPRSRGPRNDRWALRAPSRSSPLTWRAPPAARQARLRGARPAGPQVHSAIVSEAPAP